MEFADPDVGASFYRGLPIGEGDRAIAVQLSDLWTERYRRRTDGADLREFRHGEADFLLDLSERESSRETRPLGASGHLSAPLALRDEPYQRGYPLAAQDRALDRGHLIPHSGGGLYAPNLFPQDRNLNRGWSVDGQRYREIENRAVADGGLFFCALMYCDESDYPAIVELGLITAGRLEVTAFRNRFDPVALRAHPMSDNESAQIDELLASLSNSQIGDVGEETARAHLESYRDATMVALGDAGMERHDGRQDLDIVALDEAGNFIVYEVKTRFFGRIAGMRTKSGNLRQPRLTPGARTANGERRPRQGSSDYVRSRLEHVIDVDGDADFHVLLVDLVGRWIQEFGVDRDGKITGPVGDVEDCSEAVRMGLDVIVGWRGSSWRL